MVQEFYGYYYHLQNGTLMVPCAHYFNVLAHERDRETMSLYNLKMSLDLDSLLGEAQEVSRENRRIAMDRKKMKQMMEGKREDKADKDARELVRKLEK